MYKDILAFLETNDYNIYFDDLALEDGANDIE